LFFDSYARCICTPTILPGTKNATTFIGPYCETAVPACTNPAIMDKTVRDTWNMQNIAPQACSGTPNEVRGVCQKWQSTPGDQYGCTCLEDWGGKFCQVGHWATA
jgi:hypothetical protein